MKNNIYKAGAKFNKAMQSIVNDPETGINEISISTGGKEIANIKSTTMKQQFKRRYKILTKYSRNVGLQWAYGYDLNAKKKDITSIQIGFKMSIPGIVGKMMTGEEADPIKPVVVKNAEIIQDMLRVAMDEIGKK